MGGVQRQSPALFTLPWQRQRRPHPLRYSRNSETHPFNFQSKPLGTEIHLLLISPSERRSESTACWSALVYGRFWTARLQLKIGPVRNPSRRFRDFGYLFV